MQGPSPIPVTVFTGFLGSGKTTIILSLLPRVPQGYKLCLLKNEFGDVKVDSELAQESNLAVQEMLNGCLCCVLVGQMKLALMELKEKYNPDRVIIETSGSAFPAPIAWQIREMADDGFTLDSIITVIDCVNFRGYEDTSYTAKIQAQYTDIILLNKHELVGERELDLVIDHVNDLNTDTPKIKCEGKRGVSPDLIFGIDTKLFSLTQNTELIDPRITDHHQAEVDLIQVIVLVHGNVSYKGGDAITTDLTASMTKRRFETFLESLPKDDIYRLKGIVKLADHSNLNPESITHLETNDVKWNEQNNHMQKEATEQMYIVNHAFGRYTLTPIQRMHNLPSMNIRIKITIMGTCLKTHLGMIKTGLAVSDEHVVVHFAHH
ncbi:5252_t:CDS:2 [Acaulospora morrowiae]|uniref:5252_t:CDS:1 n=1 Tax=Acaulospora morrowiae TaxID=94023 RepID=A0A9N9A2M6_9GLOM|nr:5252_t:CDS:2 [Acaulospora morrowiae]